MRVPVSLVPVISDLLRERSVGAAAHRATFSKPNRPACEVPAPGRVRIDGPVEALSQLQWLRAEGVQAGLVMLDPHYRARAPSGRAHYLAEILPLLTAAAEIAQHVIVWGLPMTVARLVDHQPSNLMAEAWVTWVYKNSANRARSWRGAQQVALHFRRPDAKLNYQSFLSEEHRAAHVRNRLPYLMTARDVLDPIIEEPLNSGFIRRNEQQPEFKGGQKPLDVLKPLIQMTTQPGDLVVDPTCGSGSTGEAAATLQRRAILSDRMAAHLGIARRRLADYR